MIRPFRHAVAAPILLLAVMLACLSSLASYVGQWIAGSAPPSENNNG